MLLKDDQTWIGAGLKIGGILGVAGAETFEGVATRIDSWNNPWNEINISSMRLGLGLGGSIGTAVFFAFNTLTLYGMEQTRVSDWGLNVVVPELKVNIETLKFSLDLTKYVEGTEFLSKAFIGGMTIEKMAHFRDLATSIYNTAELYTDNNAKLILLDLPLGWGAELSAFVSEGEFSVGEAVIN